MVQEIWHRIIQNIDNGISNVESINQLKKVVFHKQNSYPITFGTAGWRAIIGQEYTIYMVQKLTAAIVLLYQQNETSLKESGIVSFSELQKKGILLGHDNRIFTYEFALAVATVFEKNQIPVFYAKEATTPELSAAVAHHHYAASINLTPSHNPAPYGGYKFNNCEGAPADQVVTTKISELCNQLSFDAFELTEKPQWIYVDTIKAYREFVQKNKVLDLDICIQESHKDEVALAIDPFYGSSKSKVAELLNYPKSLKSFHTEKDPFFTGKSPEPNDKNLTQLKAYLDGCSQTLKLGGIMDPDGDRVLLYDGHMVLPMNQFGVIAFHYLKTYRKQTGGVAKSVATSDFIKPVAKQLGEKCYETPIGFKNFKNYLTESTLEKALICFEESDGISAYHHIKEKDALFGYLLALEITVRLKKNLSQYLKELQLEACVYYPLKTGVQLNVERMKNFNTKIKSLQKKMSVGSNFKLLNGSVFILKIDEQDGVKWILSDGSWFLIRPSGTEPKVRIYAESFSLEQSKSYLEQVKSWL